MSQQKFYWQRLEFESFAHPYKISTAADSQNESAKPTEPDSVAKPSSSTRSTFSSPGTLTLKSLQKDELLAWIADHGLEKPPTNKKKNSDLADHILADPQQRIPNQDDIKRIIDQRSTRKKGTKRT
ncbi:hypothetical protein CPB83DRAFT_834299 [Crepidotus variabilis]|uniref:Uncharacterized protein n=1 Tax=Crepidotus variabilis TaxID=179855 RepID=A0A9P6EIJ1_9AGAR|nr:hypothetical protein CPB83DRAFT_834299 [Crepidotus variabilis]